MTAHHRADRKELTDLQQKRRDEESRIRTRRFLTGVSGMWERVTGEYDRKRLQNVQEAKACHERDRKEFHALVRQQLQERQELEKTVKAYRQEGLAETSRLRKEIAHYIGTATEPPQMKRVDTPPLAAQIALIETQLSVMSGDVLSLQAALESDLISDELRARIRMLIEKSVAALRFKAVDTVTQQQKEEAKAREFLQKQDEFNELVRRYAELQQKQEEERRQYAVNREFYALVSTMSYSLNGIPRYQIIVTVPERFRLDERAYAKSLRQQDNAELLRSVFKSHRPPLKPELAVPELRQSVLQVKELLGRANLHPSGGGKPTVAPTLPGNATIKFNTVKRQA